MIILFYWAKIILILNHFLCIFNQILVFLFIFKIMDNLNNDLEEIDLLYNDSF